MDEDTKPPEESEESEEWFEDEDEFVEEWEYRDTEPRVYLSPEESERVCVNSGRFWNTYPND